MNSFIFILILQSWALIDTLNHCLIPAQLSLSLAQLSLSLISLFLKSSPIELARQNFPFPKVIHIKMGQITLEEGLVHPIH